LGILQQLSDFIAIPNQSPGFDKEVLSNGHQDEALALLLGWAKAQAAVVEGLSVTVVREPDRTPVLLCQVPAFLPSSASSSSSSAAAPCVLMYGHADKQPPMLPWSAGLGPWSPVLRDGKLYGRGGADDGYALYASLSSIACLQAQRVAHARVVILIEFCEESGSRDLPFYLDSLSSIIGTPSLVVCLDSGCGNYNQLWLTSSLRGMLVIDLKVAITSEGVHSGSASGIVPSTFRIARLLLDRVEDATTGKLPDVWYAQIPEADVKFARAVAETVSESVVKKFPFLQGAGPLLSADRDHKYSRNSVTK